MGIITPTTIGIAYAGLLLLLLVNDPKTMRDVFAARLYRISYAFKKEYFIFGSFFLFLSLVATPISVIFDWFDRKFSSRRKLLVEVWHLFFLLSSLGVLLARAQIWPLLAVPVAKIFDLGQAMLFLTMRPRRASRGKFRPLLHLLLIHYPQVAVTFACVYIFLGAHCKDRLFIGHVGSELHPLDALYFSFIAFATVGFGDITPNLPSQARSICCTTALYVLLEIFAALALTLLFVPYFVTLATGPNDRSKTSSLKNRS